MRNGEGDTGGEKGVGEVNWGNLVFVIDLSPGANLKTDTCPGGSWLHSVCSASPSCNPCNSPCLELCPHTRVLPQILVTIQEHTKLSAIPSSLNFPMSVCTSPLMSHSKARNCGDSFGHLPLLILHIPSLIKIYFFLLALLST